MKNKDTEQHDKQRAELERLILGASLPQTRTLPPLGPDNTLDIKDFVSDLNLDLSVNAALYERLFLQVVHCLRGNQKLRAGINTFLRERSLRMLSTQLSQPLKVIRRLSREHIDEACVQICHDNCMIYKHVLVMQLPDYLLCAFAQARRRADQKDLQLHFIVEDMVDYLLDLDDNQLMLEAEENLTKLVYRPEGLAGELFLGLPAELACKVGLAYYQGTWLPFDRDRARVWLEYAALAGSPRARLAVLMFFTDLQSFRFNAFNGCLLRLINIHGGAQLLAECSDPLAPALCYTLDGRERRLDDDLLCSVIGLYVRVRAQDAPGEYRHFDNCQRWLGNDLLETLQQRDTPELRAALLKFYDCCDQYFADELLTYVMEMKQGRSTVTEVVSNEKFREAVASFVAAAPGGPGEELYRAWVRSSAFRSGVAGGKTALNKLAAAGWADALYLLGSDSWLTGQIKDPEGEATRLWREAAAAGHGLGLFNSALASLIAGHNDKALNLAGASLDTGVGWSFFILYRVYLDTQPQLAHTCLRYAAQYLNPAAVAELSQLRQNGTYKPLPYMCTLELIEKCAAEGDILACRAMAMIHLETGLMPFDPLESLRYVKLAVGRGDTEALAILHKALSNEIWDYLNQNMPLPSMRNALHEMLACQQQVPPPDEKRADATEQLLVNCLRELSEGKSELEACIYLASLRGSFWTSICSQPHIEKYMKGLPPAGERREMLGRLVAALACGPVAEAESGQVKMMLKVLQGFSCDDQRYPGLRAAARALLWLRGTGQAVSYDEYRKCLRQGCNAHDLVSLGLWEICVDGLRERDEDGFGDSREPVDDEILQVEQPQ